MGSLSIATFSALGLPPTPLVDLQDPHASHRTPLEHLLSRIYFLPMTWRKWLLDLCRIQADPMTNHTLSSNYAILEPQVAFAFPQDSPPVIFPKQDLLWLSMHVYDSELCCSILSYFVRAESTSLLGEFLQQKEETINKEIKAALHFAPHQQLLNYSSLFGGELNPLAPGFDFLGRQGNVQRLLRARINSFKSTHGSSSAPLLFPTYSGRKTVGYTTQELLMEARDEIHTDRTPYDKTSLSLLSHYHHSGEMIGGPLEVRVSWKFNDLKPRTYYCLGGESFWAGLYVKPIMNYLIQALPSTAPYSRYNIQRIGTLSSDQLLVTYDYTSFTTCLEELKFFMHQLADSLSGTTVRCLDVRKGEVEIDVGDYLHAYNRLVNQHQEYDLRRISPKSSRGDGTTYRQGRSGSLGVQGNIVSSTMLHGIVLGMFTNTPEADSCVGDDALAAITKSIFPLFIHAINLLGTVHPDKFTTFEVPAIDDPTLATRQQFKYLKRPLTVDFMGALRSGTLEFFPGIADFLFPEGDGVHNGSYQSNPLDRLRSLCTQWGRFLFLHMGNCFIDTTSDTDLSIICAAIRICYDKMALDQAGGIPGDHCWDINGNSMVVDFFYPPCDSTDVFGTNWLDTLFTRRHGEMILEPVRVGGTLPPNPHVVVGQRMRSTSDVELVRLLEDLGYLVSENVVIEVEFTRAYLDRLERSWKSGETGPILQDVLIVEELPDWYFPIASRLSYELEVVDIVMKQVEINSVSGVSYDL